MQQKKSESEPDQLIGWKKKWKVLMATGWLVTRAAAMKKKRGCTEQPKVVVATESEKSESVKESGMRYRAEDLCAKLEDVLDGVLDQTIGVQQGDIAGKTAVRAVNIAVNADAYNALYDKTKTSEEDKKKAEIAKLKEKLEELQK